MISLSIDAAPLLAAGDRLVAGLLRESESALRSVAGDAVVEMAAVTPPGSSTVRGESALARGRASVLAGALAVVRPVPGIVRGAETTAAVVRRHRRGGRTARVSRRIVVPRADFDAYLAKTFPRVGYTAGGWEVAARALGRSLPEWIEDVNGPGSIAIAAVGDVVTIEARNEVPWLGELSGLAGRYARVMADHEAPLATALLEAWARSRSAAGFA